MSTGDAASKIPPGPASVPAELTAPTRAFRLHAWVSTAALVGFVLVYLALTAWLATMIYRFLRDGVGGNLFVGVLQSLAPALLLFVLVRGLFAIRRGSDLQGLVEVQPEDEPTLFAFLNDIADQARAPRPHKVFLAPEVNAAVFYDLGFVNFLFPTKKNLLIGLGLLNVLTLSELRAVLAHEFGHFAQRTMAVGRWVYLAEQIAAHIVASRSRLDRWLQTLSVQDPRIAWIGWILRLCVWAVRAVLDTMYLLVALSKRALSREMELQADLVAVSLTGSDALVHALHKAHAADQGFNSAFATLRRELAAGQRVTDVYALQQRYIENIRRITDEPTYGATPPLPAERPGEHRVFKKLLAQPSKMWSTHPPDREREDNAKRLYVPCVLDDRSAWELFREPARTRALLTDKLVEIVLNSPATPGAPAPAPLAAPTAPVAPAALATPLELEHALALVDGTFERVFHRPEYRGVYLGRPLTRHVASSNELFDPSAAVPWSGAVPSTDELYPPQRREEIEQWKQLIVDHALLEGLRDGRLTASDATMHYRGSPVRRWELPALVERVGAEKRAAAESVARRDREIRTMHQRLARAIGKGWPAYHESLVRLVHYAEHTAADIADANGHLNNVFQVVIADGHVSASEFQRLLAAANVAYEALARAYSSKEQVVVPPSVLGKMNRAASRREQEHVATFSARLGELQLHPPNHMNLGDWLPVAQSWLRTVPFDFEALADAAVEELLEVEAKLRAASHELEEAPAPAQVPSQYATMEPGRERELQRTLGWWDRFQLADGLVPGVARAVVAMSLIGAMGALGRLAIAHSLYVYNGLEVPVRVTIANQRETLVRGGGFVKLSIGSEERIRVRTVTDDGRLVEAFEEDVSNGQRTYVYNVARAALLYHRTLTYGLGPEIQRINEQSRPELLGNPRLITDDSWVRFGELPRQVSLRRGERSTTRTMLNAPGLDVDPERIVGAMRTDEERVSLVRAHLRFDPPGPRLRSWARIARGLVPDLDALLRQRIEQLGAHAVELMRVELDLADARERAAVCARHRQWAEAHPGAAAVYLVARCTDDREARGRALREGFDRYAGDPDRPLIALALAWDAAGRGAWSDALNLLETARAHPSAADGAAQLEARVRRVQWALSESERGGPPIPFDSLLLSDLAARSAALARQLDDERREDGPFVELSRGQLDEALARAQTQELRRYVERLVGASEGATRSQIERALEVPSEERPLAAEWLAALWIRERGSVPNGLAAAIRAENPQWDELSRWLLSLRAQGGASADREVLPGFARPTAMAMATIVLGGRAPIAWRTVARAFFFTSERPYFRPYGGEQSGDAREPSAAATLGLIGASGDGSRSRGPRRPSDVHR